MDPQEPKVGQTAASVEPPVGGTATANSDDQPKADETWLSHLFRIGKTAVETNIPSADFLRQVAQSPNPPAEIIGQAAKAQFDQLRKAYDNYKQGRYSEAFGHTVAGAFPVAGPIVAHAAEELGTGTPEGGDRAVGTILGAAAPLMTEAPIRKGFATISDAFKASQAAKTATGAGEFTKVMPDMMKAIPPSSTTPYTPADIQRAMPYLRAEHGTAPIQTVEGFRDAADSAITQIEEKVHSYVQTNPSDVIRTNPLASARAFLAHSVRASDMTGGMRELSDLSLDQPITVERADAIRLRLNAENKAVLKKNNYDVATARQVDPGFAAREKASESLRNGIYDQLAERGIQGVDELRRDEGAIIKLRNAATRQQFNGEKAVSGTGSNTLTAKVARKALPVAGGVAGAAIGGPMSPVTAGAGVVLGNQLAEAVTPANLTRDALIERAFAKVKGAPAAYPEIPPTQAPRGLLPSHPIESQVPDTSYVRGVRAVPPVQTPLRMLPSHQPVTELGAGPDTSGLQVIEARGRIVRDPKTGRFKRIYTSEGSDK